MVIAIHNHRKEHISSEFRNVGLQLVLINRGDEEARLNKSLRLGPNGECVVVILQWLCVSRLLELLSIIPSNA